MNKLGVLLLTFAIGSATLLGACSPNTTGSGTDPGTSPTPGATTSPTPGSTARPKGSSTTSPTPGATASPTTTP